jgi:hypothetical protein
MSRRYLVTTAGILIGSLVVAYGVYLSHVQAGDKGVNKTSPNKSVTIAERDLKSLLERVNSLEARVQALETNVERVTALEARVQALESQGGIHLINGANGTMVLPEQRASDGFGPAKTILIESMHPTK